MTDFLPTLLGFSLTIAAGSAIIVQQAAPAQSIRPPSVPLVVSDPYLSIWSAADRLTDDTTRHWTGQGQPLASLVRIDGRAYRIMGPSPSEVPALPQTSLQVLPTRSIYTFDGGGIDLRLTFMTPALPNDLNVLTRPVTYLIWTAQASDGKSHAVSLYFDAAADVAVNNTDEPVVCSRVSSPGMSTLRVGTQWQPTLETAGDYARIDWGYFYVSVPQSESPKSVIAAGSAAQEQFASLGTLPESAASPTGPQTPAAGAPHLAFTMNMGTVGAAPVRRYLMAAYDEVYSINYFWTYLRPYWRRNGADAVELLKDASHDYASLIPRCVAFDQELMTDMTREGGSRYAQVGALAYRQCLGGTGIAADADGKPILFTKEDTSNGDIATVDVIFPMDPMLLLFSPTLAKASLVANLDYARSSHWRFPNAPHDLGVYPIAWGRDDGGEAMPVEESANILILCDAVAQEEGGPQFAERYWPELSQWAQFLQQYGLDPGNQLCTDDFMGPSPHNANLSVKAIIGLAAYGDLCRMRGDNKDAQSYAALARMDVDHWIQTCDSGDHSWLAFDKPGTWSQKYNMVWDRILSLNVFPPEVAAKEVAFYKTMLQPYGAPLDSRTKISETPWTYWVASLTTNQSDFSALTDPLVTYFDKTTNRVPLADSNTSTDVGSNGMHARPVVGGIFSQMLIDRAMWKKWARRDTLRIEQWASFPDLAVVPVVPAADTAPTVWRFSLADPGDGDGWASAGYDDASWASAPGSFGDNTKKEYGIDFPFQTVWSTPDIWMRRTVDIPSGVDLSKLQVWANIMGSGTAYINGVRATAPIDSLLTGYALNYAPHPIFPQALAALKPGLNVLAVHVHRTGGDGSPQFADAGLVLLQPKEQK